MPGSGLDGRRRLLAGGSGKPGKGAEELGMADEGTRAGGGQPKGIWDIFQGGSTGSVAFQVVYVGDDPLNRTGPRDISTQDCV